VRKFAVALRSCVFAQQNKKKTKTNELAFANARPTSPTCLHHEQRAQQQMVKDEARRWAFQGD
jgi:hypothetical protein